MLLDNLDGAKAHSDLLGALFGQYVCDFLKN